MLASLCDEGVAVRRPGGVYHLAPASATWWRRRGDGEPDDLSGVVDDLLARTHKRAYAAVVRAGVLRIVIERGLQGMPKLPGHEPGIRDNAHALALGKVVLALSPPEAVDRYIALGLRAVHAAHDHEPDELRAELKNIRRTGVAVEREEFDGDFCCLAAPLLDARRRFLGGARASRCPRAPSRSSRGARARSEREHASEVSPPPIPAICGCHRRS